MTHVPKKCVRRHSEAEFEVSEKLSRVVFQNPNGKSVHEITVDGCVFKRPDVLRCDYLVNVLEIDTSVFVELKGSDIDHALEQLEASSEALSARRHGRVYWIVCHSGRPAHTSEMQTLILKARRQKNARLTIAPSPHYHKL